MDNVVEVEGKYKITITDRRIDYLNIDCYPQKEVPKLLVEFYDKFKKSKFISYDEDYRCKFCEEVTCRIHDRPCISLMEIRVRNDKELAYYLDNIGLEGISRIKFSFPDNTYMVMDFSGNGVKVYFYIREDFTCDWVLGVAPRLTVGKSSLYLYVNGNGTDLMETYIKESFIKNSVIRYNYLQECINYEYINDEYFHFMEERNVFMAMIYSTIPRGTSLLNTLPNELFRILYQVLIGNFTTFQIQVVVNKLNQLTRILKNDNNTSVGLDEQIN